MKINSFAPLFAIIALLVIASPSRAQGGTLPVRAQAQSYAISQKPAGATRAEVHLEVGVSQLFIGALTSSDRLVEGTVETRRGERLEQDFRINGNTAVLNLESKQNNAALPFFRGSGGRTWSLRLNPSLPIALDIDTGVGQVDLDLSALNLTSLKVDGGVGETTITLPLTGQIKADISTGIGPVTIRIPEGVAARVRISEGIGSLEVRGDYERLGDLYVSSDYDSAASRVDLSVDGGIGSVLVTSSP